MLTDNDDSAHVKIAGDWKKITTGGYGPSYLITGPSDVEKSIQFIPQIKVSGSYEVYAYIPEVDRAARQRHFTVYDGKISKDVFINKSDLQVEGQTSGEWISLGKYKFQNGRKTFATITNKNADGEVAADAILFKPMK